MIERILLITLTTIYLFMFILRNLIVKKRINQPIRKADLLVRSAIILTTFCFTVTILSTSDKWYQYMGEIACLRNHFFTYIGLVLFFIGIILCWVFSSQLKDSWRVGVHEDQKTDLITNGIYTYVRNPYFDAYFLMFFSLILIRPSIVLFILVVSTVTVYHIMVLKEEAYLLEIHGENYDEYKTKTGRYLPRFG